MNQLGEISYFNPLEVKGGIQLANGDLLEFCVDNIRSSDFVAEFYPGLKVLIERNPVSFEIRILNKKPLKSRITFILLALFLGGLGIHNYYIGNKSTATVQLLLNVFFCWTIVIPFGIMFWVLIEMITTSKDSLGRPLYWD